VITGHAASAVAGMLASMTRTIERTRRAGRDAGLRSPRGELLEHDPKSCSLFWIRSCGKNNEIETMSDSS